MIQDLEINRSHADRQSLVFLWLHVPAIALLAWSNGTNIAALGLLGLATAILAQVVQHLAKGQLAGRVTLAVALMVQVSLGVAALEGHTWQVEVNTAVDQMDQNTQKNAAMVEEATAATKNLALQSDELNGMIASFVTTSKAILGKARGSKLQRGVPSIVQST